MLGDTWPAPCSNILILTWTFQLFHFGKTQFYQQCFFSPTGGEIRGPQYLVSSHIPKMSPLLPSQRLQAQLVRKCWITTTLSFTEVTSQTPTVSAPGEWLLSGILKAKCSLQKGSELTDWTVSENPWSACLSFLNFLVTHPHAIKCF